VNIQDMSYWIIPQQQKSSKWQI